MSGSGLVPDGAGRPNSGFGPTSSCAIRENDNPLGQMNWGTRVISNETRDNLSALLGRTLLDLHGEHEEAIAGPVINDVVAQRVAATDLGKTKEGSPEVDACLARAALTHFDPEVREAALESLRLRSPHLGDVVACLGTMSALSDVRESSLRMLQDFNRGLGLFRAGNMARTDPDPSVRDVAAEFIQDGPTVQELRPADLSIEEHASLAAAVLYDNTIATDAKSNLLGQLRQHDEVLSWCVIAVLCGGTDAQATAMADLLLTAEMPQLKGLLEGS